MILKQPPIPVLIQGEIERRMTSYVYKVTFYVINILWQILISMQNFYTNVIYTYFNYLPLWYIMILFTNILQHEDF